VFAPASPAAPALAGAPRPDGEQLEHAREAVRLCPGQALSLVED
jgi:ferredoxin